ncbi:MAG TPA: hypothetical protein PKK23_06530 [Nitrospirales bacterium]|nr:hypothetical protein [Nitrospiraceae bacterium]HNP28681.1 hypothetical protein [Nitrospirales bacterium]
MTGQRKLADEVQEELNHLKTLLSPQRKVVGLHILEKATGIFKNQALMKESMAINWYPFGYTPVSIRITVPPYVPPSDAEPIWLVELSGGC